MIAQLITRTRTFRRFKQQKPISSAELELIIDLARLGGSARNSQPWQYMPISDQGLCLRIFPFLGLAGYLTDWPGPAEGERPTAYILCFLNKKWQKGPDREAHFDLGIASQNMLLGAMYRGIGGCRIGAFSPKLAQLWRIPEHLSLQLVIALGYPAEQVTLAPVDVADGDIRYWRDVNGLHHVPKRSLDDVIVSLKLIPEITED